MIIASQSNGFKKDQSFSHYRQALFFICICDFNIKNIHLWNLSHLFIFFA